MADFVLRLTDTTSTIGFVDQETSGYELIDGSLDIGDPESRDQSTGNSYADGAGIIRSVYGERRISFAYRVRSATIRGVMSAIAGVNAMLENARSPLFLAGGAYDGTHEFYEDYDAGTGGVRLVVAIGTGVVSSASVEALNPPGDRERVFSFAVLKGTQRVLTPMSIAGVYKNGTQYYAREVQVDLVCEPFALGVSRVAKTYTSNGGYIGTPSSYTSATQINRMVIDGNTIEGDAPAATRIATKLSGAESIIIARDAGHSLLNAATVPVRSGAGATGVMLVSGTHWDPIGKEVVVTVTAQGTPDVITVYLNGSPIALTGIQGHTLMPLGVGAGGASTNGALFLFFSQSTGHALNQSWTFYTNQSYFYPNTTTNVYSDYSGYLSLAGTSVGSFQVNVPREVRKRYKIMANLAEASYVRTEYRAGISFGFCPYNGDSLVWTQEVYNDWVLPPTHITTTIDLGPLDLTGSGTPALAHPGSITVARITIYARGNEELAGAHNVVLSHAFMVPASDPNSYIRAAWKTDTLDGWEVYSNYDEKNPYIGESTAVYLDDTSFHGQFTVEGGFAAPLDSTWIGRHITLVPRELNTLYFLPVFEAGGEYNKGWVTTAQTGEVYVAYRPKHLFVG